MITCLTYIILSLVAQMISLEIIAAMHLTYKMQGFCVSRKLSVNWLYDGISWLINKGSMEKLWFCLIAVSLKCIFYKKAPHRSPIRASCWVTVWYCGPTIMYHWLQRSHLVGSLWEYGLPFVYLKPELYLAFVHNIEYCVISSHAMMEPDYMTVAVNYFLNYVLYYENIISIKYHLKTCCRHEYDDFQQWVTLFILS